MGGQSEQNLAQYGEPLTYEKSFKGPLAKRSCTDVICLLIFLVFLGCWAFVAYFAFTKGDLNKLLVPTDSNNRKCGLDSDVLDKKYLFFFDLTKCIDPLVTISGCPTPQVCVEKCPTETFVFSTFKGNIAELKKKLICIDSAEKTKIKSYDEARVLVENGRCAAWYVNSQAIQKRCIPYEDLKDPPITLLELDSNFLQKASFSIKNLNGLGQQLVEDIINSWLTILVALIGAMVTSLIFIVLMRWLAAPVVWFSIIGVLAGLGYAVYITAEQYIYWRDTPHSPNHAPNLVAKMKNWFQDKNTWLAITIIVSIVLVILLLVVIFLRKRIVIAIALIKEGSKAVGSIISTVFFPVFPWIFQIATIAFAIVVGMHLASIGDPSFKVIGKFDNCKCSNAAENYEVGGACIPEVFKQYCREGNNACSAGCFFQSLQGPSFLSYMHAYNVVGFFWLMFFISAFGEMVLAATFATWYWTFHKSDVPFFTLTQAFGRTVRYHMGTLALGSLIITICRIIRLILEFIDAQLKKYDNPFTRAILCCMKCFFWCLENFLRFLNKNAYIMCAIHGKNFCTSAKDAFNLLMRNVLRVVTVDKVTDLLFLFSKLLISAAIGAATYFYVDGFPEQYKLHYNWVPTAIVVIVTYLIATVFFGVYSMAVDTLFLCFLEDSERNDGTAEKPYFMSKSLMKILGKRNEVPRHQYQ